MAGWRDELKHTDRGLLFLAEWIVLSLLMAVSGPFGTYEKLEFMPRLLYWAAISGGALMLGSLTCELLRVATPGIGYRVRVLATAAANALFIGFAIWRLSLALLDGSAVPAPAFSDLALAVFVVSLGVSSLRLTRDLAETDRERQPAPSPRLLDRLEPQFQGQLLRLSVNDHYVEVVTDRGVASVLMRFSDALAELEGVDGHRVHRSHWVARDAVVGTERQRNRLFLKTTDGVSVPVSATYRDDLMRQGVIASEGT